MNSSTTSTLYILLFLAFANVFSFAGFVQTRNIEFVEDGSRFLFNGFNSYWMMTVASDPTQRYKVSNAFEEAADAGYTVCRTWAFSDGGLYGVLQTSPGVYNEYVFQALDFVISQAKKYEIRLILSLINNYKDYGGRPQYCDWARSFGVTIHNDDEFYTNDVIKGYYKNHAYNVIARVNTITGVAYKDDPTIMAWELMNEPRCQIDISGELVTEWLQEMASYVKSIDNIHLVGNGMEGFYGPERRQNNPQGFLVGTDFISSHQIKEIDFASIHAYPDTWLSGQDNNSQISFLQNWLSSHWTDSVTILKKPLILGEFGKSSKDPGYTASARDSYISFVYDTIYNDAIKGGFGGGLVWQIFPPDLSSYDDGYEIVLSQNPSTDYVISQQSKRMLRLALLSKH